MANKNISQAWALTGAQIFLILIIAAILIISFLWLFCVIDNLFGVALPVSPLCNGGMPPLAPEDEEEEEEPEPVCEDLDVKLGLSIPAYLLAGETACGNAGMDWIIESGAVGCGDPFVPGRINCNPYNPDSIVSHTLWPAFVQECITAGGEPICNRKFAGCLCDPTGAYECGWSWTYNEGSECSGTCDSGGLCTPVDEFCMCKSEDDHILCDEYIIEGELACVGYCENENEFCEYQEGVCDCWEFL